MNNDEQYMKIAIDLAKNAIGRTTPNPLVGAVIVKDGRIAGCGWHKKAGTPHAEVHALNAAGNLAEGGTIYVTLEPCSHFGRTPPCCDAIINAGLKRAVIAISDPNPQVAGQGIKKMREAGIEVITGILADEAEKLNKVFFKWIEKKLPFITIKSAMTLDGKIATASGESKWITNAKSREYGHHLRDTNDAIMVGINTVLADNPALTTRLAEGGKNPIRIVVDRNAKIPLDAALINDGSAPVIIAVTTKAPQDKIAALRNKGIEVLSISADDNGRVYLPELLKKLGQKDICSLLVEGGASLIGSIIKEKLADKAYFFIAPKIIGGETARTAVGGSGIQNLNDAVKLHNTAIEILDGGDILVTGDLY